MAIYAFLLLSCDNKTTQVIDINNYFQIELDSSIKYQKCTQDSSLGYDLNSSENENLRIVEIPYDRISRSLPTHVELFPKELIVQNDFELISLEPFQTDTLTGTSTHYKDDTSDHLLWCLYHENRFLFILKVTNNLQSTDKMEVEKIINKIRIKETIKTPHTE